MVRSVGAAVNGSFSPRLSEGWHYTFTNTFSEEESRRLYERYHVPASAGILWDSILANLKPGHQETWVDYRNDSRAPLLFIGGSEDQIMPPTARRCQAAHYKSGAITEYKEFEGRAHLMLAQKGWEGVADYALSWAVEHATRRLSAGPSSSGRTTNGTFIERIGFCDIRCMRSQPSQQVMEPAKSQPTDLHSLESFLAGRGEAPGIDLIRRTGLAGWAYTRLPSEHPMRPQLRRDFLAVQAHHLTLKREFIPLVAAWRKAGIEVVLFRGFWLAETVFPSAGARLHGDVDVLLRPSQVREARAISQTLGWVDHPGAMDRPHSDAALRLGRPAGQCWVDAHRFVLHSQVRWNQTQRRITDAVWSWSRARAWEGMDVRELDPTDAVLVLMLQRCWRDGWRLRPIDWLDLRQLIEAHAVSRSRVIGRAYALGCARTVFSFLERCDPWTVRLDLRPPTPSEVKQYRRSVVTERPLLAVEPWLARVPRLPGLLIDVLRVLPSVLRAGIALRRRQAIPEILQQLTPLPCVTRSNLQRRVRTVCGVHSAVKLLGNGKRGGGLLRTLALYRALRLEGWPVTFVSGLRRENDRPTDHAWIELDGRVLPELLEPQNTLKNVVAFRYPAPAIANTRLQRSIFASFASRDAAS